MCVLCGAIGLSSYTEIHTHKQKFKLKKPVCLCERALVRVFLLMGAFLRVSDVCVPIPVKGAGVAWWMTKPWEHSTTPSSHGRRHLPPALLRIIRVRKWTVVTTCARFFLHAEDKWSPINFILMIPESKDRWWAPEWRFHRVNRVNRFYIDTR